MIKKNLILLLVLFFAVGMSVTAKDRIVSSKKFKSNDIGHPALAGATKVLEDGMEITAGGVDIWGTHDEFRFAWLEQNGDFDLAVRIESLSDPHLYTKAGIMARQALNDDSRHIFFQVFPNNNARNKNNGGYEFQYRNDDSGEMKAIYPSSIEGPPEFPVNYPNTWIRLKRTGDDFTGSYSADGKTWKTYTNYNLNLPKKLYLGLAVTSHNADKTATAVFKDISNLK